jgi:hypothetical protein
MEMRHLVRAIQFLEHVDKNPIETGDQWHKPPFVSPVSDTDVMLIEPG